MRQSGNSREETAVEKARTRSSRTDHRALTVAQVERAEETQEKRARRLFDDMARHIGREAVNHLKTMYPGHLTDHAHSSKSWETSVIGHIRNGINWRMRPLLMATIAMHREWEEEAVGNRVAEERDDEQA